MGGGLLTPPLNFFPHSPFIFDTIRLNFLTLNNSNLKYFLMHRHRVGYRAVKRPVSVKKKLFVFIAAR